MSALVVGDHRATPLLSGGWLVDVGDAWPVWVPHRDDALDLLAARSIDCPAGPGVPDVGSPLRVGRAPGSRTPRYGSGAPTTFARTG